jgi:hypothetical protein
MILSIIFMKNFLTNCVNVVYPLMTNELEEEFSDYILRVLKEKDLKQLRVSQKTNKKIDQSSITKLISGNAQGDKTTIKTLYWLAIGMNEPPLVVFAKALGLMPKDLGVRVNDSPEMLELDFYLTQMSKGRLRDMLTIARAFFEMDIAVQPEPEPAAKLRGKVMTLEEAFADNERKMSRKKSKK